MNILYICSSMYRPWQLCREPWLWRYPSERTCRPKLV